MEVELEVAGAELFTATFGNASSISEEIYQKTPPDGSPRPRTQDETGIWIKGGKGQTGKPSGCCRLSQTTVCYTLLSKAVMLETEIEDNTWLEGRESGGLLKETKTGILKTVTNPLVEPWSC